MNTEPRDGTHDEIYFSDIPRIPWNGEEVQAKCLMDEELKQMTDPDAIIADLREKLRVAREALEKIETLKPESFDAFPVDWSEQIAKCPECQGWCKTHPIMNGICDEHRRPLYAREKHEKHEGTAIGYRMKGIARVALRTLDAEPVSQPPTP